MAGRLGYRVIEGAQDSYAVFFNNQAIANAERLMKKGIVGVLSGFQAGDSGVIEVAVLLQVGVAAARKIDRYSGKRFSNADAYKLMDEVGFSAAAAMVFEAVGEVIGRDQSAIDAEFLDDDAADPESKN